MHRKCHAVGIQEARSARDGISKCGDYIRVTSQSANGCHGCELWLNATLPFGKYYGRAARIAKGDVVVVGRPSRGYRLRVSLAELRAFCAWSATRRTPQLRNCPMSGGRLSVLTFNLLWQPAKQLCVFVDANIQLCNPLHDVVGDFGGESQSDIAGSLLDALRSLRLYVPSTFPESCKSRRVDDQATYTSKVGCVHSRIDYFLASRNVACKERSVAVDRSFDMLNDIDDHWALFG